MNSNDFHTVYVLLNQDMEACKYVYPVKLTFGHTHLKVLTVANDIF